MEADKKAPPAKGQIMSHKRAKKIRQFFRKQAEVVSMNVKLETEKLLKERIASVDRRVEELYKQHIKPKPKYCPNWLWNIGRAIYITEKPLEVKSGDSQGPKGIKEAEVQQGGPGTPAAEVPGEAV
jgi:hypothetical protein